MRVFGSGLQGLLRSVLSIGSFNRFFIILFQSYIFNCLFQSGSFNYYVLSVGLFRSGVRGLFGRVCKGSFDRLFESVFSIGSSIILFQSDYFNRLFESGSFNMFFRSGVGGLFGLGVPGLFRSGVAGHFQSVLSIASLIILFRSYYFNRYFQSADLNCVLSTGPAGAFSFASATAPSIGFVERIISIELL